MIRRNLHAIVIYPALNLNIKEFIFEVSKAFERHDVSKKIAHIPDPICFQTKDMEMRRPRQAGGKKKIYVSNERRTIYENTAQQEK